VKENQMKLFKTTFVIALAGLLASTTRAALEITPAMQREISRQTEVVKAWAANPAVVRGVLAQNERGPIPGMDNAKWKTVRRSDDLIKGLVNSEAGKFLTQKIDGSGGLFARAFLSAAQGEKVAFNEKTISYLHKGQAKFDVPMSTGKTWQGPPELDEITEAHHVQIAAPVLSGGKPVGVLVVGINLAKLEKVVKK
jgi:hypothetical protein